MNDSNGSSEDFNALMDAMLNIRNREEAKCFFDDLCTVAEQNAMAQRFRVAKLLREKRTCQDIARLTGSSTATISRVSRCLHHGSGGYAMALDRLEEVKTGNERSE